MPDPARPDGATPMEEQLDRIERAGSKVSLGNWLAIIGLSLAVLGSAGGVVMWLSKVDTTLNRLTDVIADQKNADARIEKLSSDMDVLKATTAHTDVALTGSQGQQPRHRAPAP